MALIIAAGKTDGIEKIVLERFNTAFFTSLMHLRLEIIDQRLQESWERSKISLLEPLWIILKSAYDILIEADYERIK